MRDPCHDRGLFFLPETICYTVGRKPVRKGRFMDNGQSVLKSRKYQIAMGILSLNALGTSLMMIRTMIGNTGEDLEADIGHISIRYTALRPVVTWLFLALAIQHLIQCIASFRESRLLFLKHLVYILFSAGAAAGVFFSKDIPSALPAACFIYLLAGLFGCLFDLIRSRDKWHVMLLILMLLVAFLGGCAAVLVFLGGPEEHNMACLLAISLLFFVVDVQGVALIFPLAFSSVRMDILKRIIKKTYAVEILSGIVLLIVAFSLILPAFETNIDNFGDALWYCFAIVTTIGFGDIYATSMIGRILSVILGLYGIIVVSLITSIIVNFYGEMKKEEKDEESPPDEIDDGESGEKAPDEKKKKKRVKKTSDERKRTRPERRTPDERRRRSEEIIPEGKTTSGKPERYVVVMEEIEL